IVVVVNTTFEPSGGSTGPATWVTRYQSFGVNARLGAWASARLGAAARRSKERRMLPVGKGWVCLSGTGRTPQGVVRRRLLQRGWTVRASPTARRLPVAVVQQPLPGLQVVRAVRQLPAQRVGQAIIRVEQEGDVERIADRVLGDTVGHHRAHLVRRHLVRL